MKITAMKCPYCGGSLEVDKEGPVECEYCHNTFFAEEDKAPVTMNTTINNYAGTTSPVHTQPETTSNGWIATLIGGAISLICVMVAIVGSVTAGANNARIYGGNPIVETETETVPPDYWSSMPVDSCTIDEAAGSDDVWVSDITSMAPSTMTSIKVSGAGGKTDISWLSKCTSLQELYITDAEDVTDWTVLTKLAGVTSIHIINAPQMTDISWMKNMPNIKNLELSDTGVTDVSVMSGRISILSLSLTGNAITDYSPIATLTSLTSLTIDEGSNLPDLSGLKLLKDTVYK